MTAAVLIVIAVLVALAAAARLHFSPNADVEMLRSRYAHGLITRDEYERLKNDLLSAE